MKKNLQNVMPYQLTLRLMSLKRQKIKKISSYWFQSQISKRINAD